MVDWLSVEFSCGSANRGYIKKLIEKDAAIQMAKKKVFLCKTLNLKKLPLQYDEMLLDYVRVF